MRLRPATLLMIGHLLAASSLPAAAGPPRAVSLDYCADQYLLAVADRAQVLGLSRDAGERFSFYRERAAGLPQFAGSTEEILVLAPDLVVRYWGGGPQLAAILKRAGIDLVSGDFGGDFETLFANMTRIGSALGQGARSRALAADYRRRLQALRNRPNSRLRAIYLTPSGSTAGIGTFVDNAIRLAGFISMADELEVTGWRTLPAEKLVLRPPDVVIAGFYDMSAAARYNWSVSRHNRIAGFLADLPTIHVPARFLACNGLFAIDAAEHIRRAGEARGLFEATK